MRASSSLCGVFCAAEVFVVPWAFDKASCSSFAKSRTSPLGPQVGVGSPAALCTHFIICKHTHTHTVREEGTHIQWDFIFPYIDMQAHSIKWWRFLFLFFCFLPVCVYIFCLHQCVVLFRLFILTQASVRNDSARSQSFIRKWKQRRTVLRHLLELISFFSQRGGTVWLAVVFFFFAWCQQLGRRRHYLLSFTSHGIYVCAPANWWGVCAWFLWGNPLAFHLHRGNNREHNNFPVVVKQPCFFAAAIFSYPVGNHCQERGKEKTRRKENRLSYLARFC